MVAKLIGFETARRLDERSRATFADTEGCAAGFHRTGIVRGPCRSRRPCHRRLWPRAILYDSLTGRPPFVGTLDDEIRELVLHQLPIAPRQIESNVPIALEAICLRAMNKDPAKRYSTVGAIALELQRFLTPSEPSDDSTVGPDSEAPCKRGPADAYQLRILSGPTRVGESFALSTQQIRIGRSRDCQVVLAGSKISHLHCGVVWNDEHQLVDYGSKNGTFVNGELVMSNRTLVQGDLIQLPTYVLQYEAAAR